MEIKIIAIIGLAVSSLYIGIVIGEHYARVDIKKKLTRFIAPQDIIDYDI